MPGLRTRSWLGASQGVECTSCHRQTSLTAGTILHGQARSDGLVLGGLSDGANGISALQLQSISGPIAGLDAGRQTSSIQPHIRCRGWSRSTKPPCLSGPRTTPPAAAPGEAMTASCRGRWHRGGRRQQAGPIAPGRSHRLRCRQSQRLHRPSPRPAPPRPMDGPDMPASPSTSTIPTSSAPWPHILSCPGIHQMQGLGPWRSITGCAGNTWTSSSSASTDAERGTPPSAPCSPSPSAPNLSPTTCWLRRNKVHKRSTGNTCAASCQYESGKEDGVPPVQ